MGMRGRSGPSWLFVAAGSVVFVRAGRFVLKMKFFFYKLEQIPSKGDRMDNRFGTTTGNLIQTVIENVQELCKAKDERGH